MRLDRSAVERVDRENMLKLLMEFPDQCREAYKLGLSAELPPRFREARCVVITGMGGSAIGGDLIRCALRGTATVPIIVNRHYRLPSFVDERTLVVGSSYSGNTEETLEAFDEALRRGAMCVAITSGGKLAEMADRAEVPLIKIPQGYPPRAALGYTSIPVLAALVRLGFAPNFDLAGQLEEALKVLEGMGGELNPDVEENPAKEIALKLHGRLPIIYASQDLEAVAIRWKGQMSENSKSLAYVGILPEMNHNEIEGWRHPEGLLSSLHIVMIRDPGDHERVQMRMEITKGIVKEHADGVTEVYPRGKGELAKLLSLIYLGDFVSLYLAALNGEDPTPVERIGVLKKKLAEGGEWPKSLE